MRRRKLTIACIMWLAAGANAQMLVHTSQRSPYFAPTQTSSVTAASTSEFIDSIGVACHLNYTWTAYRDFPATKALLLASGIRNIRDGGADPLAVTRLRDLAAAGVRLTWVMDPADGVAPTQTIGLGNRTICWLIF
jgi:hypothetical protein